MATMNIIENPDVVSPGLVGDLTLAEVVRGLGFEPATHGERPVATLVCRPGMPPLAALLMQSGTFREDRRWIEDLKSSEGPVPIIYLAHETGLKREAAVRRLGIHYFLAPPFNQEELRLVLEALARRSLPGTSFERFFTR